MAGYGLTRDRVVAVIASLDDGTEQVGTGYLVTDRLVLTAAHTTRNKDSTSRAQVSELRVVHVATAATADVDGEPVADPVLDVAVLTLKPALGWPMQVLPVEVWGVDRSGPGVLGDCVVIGLPRFAYDPNKQLRGTAELHGDIYQTDGAETGHLLMRDPRLHGAHDPETGESGWGGLSGALVFYQDRALGVVVEHHPHQGDNSVRLIGFHRIVANPAIRVALDLGEPHTLVCAPPAPVASSESTDPTLVRLRRILELERQGVLSATAVATLQVQTVLQEFGFSPQMKSGGALWP